MTPHVHELSNVEINKMLSPYRPSFGGVVAQADLPALHGQFFVVLIAPKSRPNNGHWVLVYDCLPDQTIMVDSMGEPPSKAIERRMRQTGKRLVFSSLDEQALRQVDCGYVAVFVASRLMEGIPLRNILEQELRPLAFTANQKLVTRKLTSTLSSSDSMTTKTIAHHGGTVVTTMYRKKKKRSAGSGVKPHKAHAVRCGGTTAEGKRCKVKGRCPHH